jgi:hypothetical protein
MPFLRPAEVQGKKIQIAAQRRVNDGTLRPGWFCVGGFLQALKPGFAWFQSQDNPNKLAKNRRLFFASF